MIVPEGLLIPFITLILISIAILVNMRLAHKKLFYIRPLPAMDAMEEVVGRAAEQGRVIHYAPGSTSVSGVYGSQTMAGITILGYVASLAGERGVGIISSVSVPEMIPIVEATILDAFTASGGADTPYEVRYHTGDMAFSAGVMGILSRENVSANIYIGGLFRETTQILEAGATAGLMQISGTDKTTQLPWMVATCDYVLMNDEMYAASVYVSKDPDLSGSVRAIDIAKAASIILIIVGVILESLGITFITSLLRK